MMLPTLKVELDDGTGTFPYDVTSKVLVADGAQVTLSRGRDDEESAVSAGVMSLTLNNSDGRFSLNSTVIASPSPIKVDTRIRVIERVNSTDFTRFTGYVKSWPVSWPAVVDTFAVVNLTATDAQARGERKPLRSFTEEEILADGPTAFYRLNSPVGAVTAADSSGGQSMLTMAGSGADVTFDETKATFSDGKHLAVNNLPVAALATGRTMEAVLTTSTVPSVISQQFLTLWVSGTTGFAISITSTGVIEAYLIDTGGAGSTNAGSVNVCDGEPRHVAATLTKSGGTTTATVYVDGVLDASTSVGWATVDTATANLQVGGGMRTVTTKFEGSLSDVAVFPEALAAGRIAEHAGARNNFSGESGTDRITRLAGYAGIPVGALDPSLTNMP